MRKIKLLLVLFFALIIVGESSSQINQLQNVDLTRNSVTLRVNGIVVKSMIVTEIDYNFTRNTFVLRGYGDQYLITHTVTTSYSINGGLTAITSPLQFKDSIADFIKRDFSGGSSSVPVGGATAVLQQNAIDSIAKTNAAIRLQDSTNQSRKGVVILNPTTILASDSGKYRSTINIGNLNGLATSVLQQSTIDSIAKVINQLKLNNQQLIVTRVNDSLDFAKNFDSVINANIERRLQTAKLTEANAKLIDVETELQGIKANQTNNLHKTKIINASGNVISDFGTVGGATDAKIQQSIDSLNIANNLLRLQDSTTQSRSSVRILNPYSVQAADSSKTRKWFSIDNFPSIGSVAAGSAATVSTLTGLQYNVTAPTLTNGQQVALQGDALGQMRVNAMIGGNDYKLSTGNSSSVQLAITATFAGAIESALGFPQILVSMRANQNTTITIRQFKDAAGTIEMFDFTGLPLTYAIPLNAGFNRQISIVGSYYRVSVINNGGASTTNFYLETRTGNFPPTPNLTLRGNLPTANNEINGTATSVNTGNVDGGTQRVVIASNQSPYNVNKNVTGGITDVASAALTTIGLSTSPTITPTVGVSYSVIIDVTAVTGTSPTMAVTIQESFDAGTTWYPVFVFPTIIASGVYRSPALPFRGTRVRYVQNVGGTTPSFTRSIVRMQSNDDVNLAYRVVSGVTNTTITTGGTSQLLAAANDARQKFMIVNNSTADLWFNYTSVAGVNLGHKLAAGQSWLEPAGVINTAAINIFGATTGQQIGFQQW